MSKKTPRAEDQAAKKLGAGTSTKTLRSPKSSETRHEKSASPLPVVGIGGSAGALEAFKELLRSLSPNTGMAFVLMQHLDPRASSNLREILARETSMPVVTVENDMAIDSNHVYVMPPNATVFIDDNSLKLEPRLSEKGIPMPIDAFLRSLAAAKRGNAVAIILSGLGSDGALGVKAVNAEGGLTFAQDENSAPYPSMPAQAVATGCVDFVLPPRKIAAELVRISQHPLIRHLGTEAESDREVVEAGESSLEKVFFILRTQTGIDFTHYKQTTIRRRIQRRMLMNKMENLKQYVACLRNNPQEVEGLCNDILIKVTSFFRDPDAFDLLKAKVFPEIVKRNPRGSPIRVWVVGCATGEEAYSVVIALLEFLGEMSSGTEIQLFATDISDRAVQKAREGLYPENISADVSAERLRRFFIKSDGGYQISKTIRDMCVFAVQDVTSDPPFSRQDLICCRNLLIYLGTALQKKVIPSLHYGLKPNGFLWLGSSEAIGGFGDHFSLIDNKFKIYARKGAPIQRVFDAFRGLPEREAALEKATVKEMDHKDVIRQADLLILNRMAPAAVVLSEGLEILQIRGDISHFVVPAPGAASLNVLKMARPELRATLRALIQKAEKSRVAEVREGIQVRVNGSSITANVEVHPLHISHAASKYFVVGFREIAPPSRSDSARVGKALPAALMEKDHELKRLEQELTELSEHLQATIEEFETSNEELKSSNEEILSSNEELQSTNEELQTAKEEIQSTNEELSTLNEELQNRNTELGQTNDDLHNLLASTRIPVVMLGNDLRIRRFTPKAQGLLRLIPTDVGRPISDINPTVNLAGLKEIVVDAIDSMQPKEVDVRDDSGNWYSMQVRPYRTSENKIDGAVLTFMDITDRKRAAAEVESIAQFAVEYPSPLMRISQKGELLYANPSAANLLKQMDWKEGVPLPDELVSVARRTLRSGSSEEWKFVCQLNKTISFLVVPIPDFGYSNLFGKVMSAEG